MKLIKKGIKITDLKPGDIVTVKSYEEITATLDAGNKYNKTYFSEKMKNMCNENHKVLEIIDRRTHFSVILRDDRDTWSFRAPWLKNIIE